MRRLAAVLLLTLLTGFLAACATTPPAPALSPQARAELAPTGKLRAGINF